jgi:hypothetical protein
VEDAEFRKYFEGQTDKLPAFYASIIEKDLGEWWQWLPKGATEHNPNAYLLKSAKKVKAATRQKELSSIPA